MDMLLQSGILLTGINRLSSFLRIRGNLASIFETSRHFDLVLNHGQRTTSRVGFKLSAGSAFQVDNIRAVHTSPSFSLSTR